MDTKKEYAPRETIIIKDEKSWPENIGKVFFKGKTLIIDGQNQWKLSGRKMPGKCDQNEKNQPLIRIKRDNVLLKNFEISESKNGITWSNSGIIFDNISFTKICEDAINPMRATKFIIKNCFFANAQDKTIQCNYCKDFTIEKNTFFGGINSIRLMGSSTDKIVNNVFNNVDTAIQVTKNGTLKIDKTKNQFLDVRTPYKTEEGGKIIFI